MGRPFCPVCDRVVGPVVRGHEEYCPAYPLTRAARDAPSPLVRGQAPVQLFVLGEDAERNCDKRLDCEWYGECLDHAASLDWDDWSCAECPVYQPANPDVVILRESQEPTSIDHVLDVD